MPLAADAQREQTVGVLRRAYLEGRLELDEFADRAGLALQARTTGELRALVRDLPLLGDWLARTRDLAVRLVVLAALGLVWTFLSFVLLIAFIAGLVPGGMSAQEALIFPLVWVLLTWTVWRVARR
jgi:hypothetical protein